MMMSCIALTYYIPVTRSELLYNACAKFKVPQIVVVHIFIVVIILHGCHFTDKTFC